MVLTTLQTPSEKFQRIVGILRTLASICGVDLLLKNYRMNWITYLLFTSIAGYFLLVFLTIYWNYQDNWTIILRACVIMFTFISNKDIIIDLYQLLSGVYSGYEEMSDKYWKALEASAKKSKRGLIYISLFFLIGYAGVVTVPYIWRLMNGERFIVLEFHLPGLDIHTDVDYYATLILQSIMVVCFGFGLHCDDLVAMIYLLQSFVLSYVFAAKIGDPDNNKKPSVTKALKNIAKWVQLYSRLKKCNSK